MRAVLLRRKHALAGLAALLLVVPAAATFPSTRAGAGPDSGALACDTLSPFAGGCEDCCASWNGHATADVGILGFVGSLRVQLVGDEGILTWNCWALGVSGVADPTTGADATRDETWHCDAKAKRTGDSFHAGDRVRLLCTADTTTGPGLPSDVGPFGPWGCSAQL